jgi:N-methylhydantoinase B
VLLGHDPERGRYLVDMLPHGGRGALPTLDGMVPVSYPENSTITPCEVLETQAPIVFHRKELRTGSGGLGEHRGGLGQTITFEHVGSEPMWFNLTPDRITTSPQGLAGGGPGTRGRALLNGEELTAFPRIILQPGDVVDLELGGGGGFGPPERRSEEAIEQDLALGYTAAASSAGAVPAFGGTGAR